MTLPFQVILNQNIQEDNVMPKWVYNQTHTLGNWDDAGHSRTLYLFHCIKQDDKQMLFYFLLYYPTWC